MQSDFLDMQYILDRCMHRIKLHVHRTSWFNGYGGLNFKPACHTLASVVFLCSFSWSASCNLVMLHTMHTVFLLNIEGNENKVVLHEMFPQRHSTSTKLLNFRTPAPL